ncbi:HlyC/CorC family transporter [Xenorhabdus nematophila]|uniref:Polyamine export protein n=1 Tax=Xenorhabdus nematophila (strain ATCC 19061 / DSM 3370 / CCUG 14189 / LMG 1036 / NCIMB 9965 / AN6) TaxID=406817 RepID=D3VIK0_XENNA|nr:hemolysin family protein [Xenorhabdus nematophila]CEE94832.1 putative hemolysin-related membrane protein with CBS regulatory domain [Xenorhabdus nematophila str. Anatoliense]CEF31556.1 putative hemolysin-related membrane protein with CBS regulatory domain [Xenorhabdus nematophila str. Websteri]AYA41330.1 HlyC/CorC family transporter [Xenorhabdus nematophila]KHD29807.1 membrane protein [Xenorhabdus nematophila]MBA0020067.1 HlyC/CorC family transporter [Xenorhabdus nematophila]
MLNSLLVIFLLCAISAFFSLSEISLAASRKIKLKLMADEGNLNAAHVLKLQETPGLFFTVVQIGLNAVAILGGVVGESAFSPALKTLFLRFMNPEWAEQLGFICSFIIVTSFFILFADLTPKRIGMIKPEAVAVRIVNPMRFCLAICRPLVWLFNGLADYIFKIFKIPMARNEDITSDDIYAVVEAGAVAGILRKQEHELIENVFELDSRAVPSAMTSRESVVYFDKNEDENSIKEKISTHPHSKFLVCDGDIDHVIGYVDSKDLLNRVLNGQSLNLKEGVQICNALMIPDTLSLSDTLESFKAAGEDFAIILNEYALVMGVITLNDVMTTLMGDLVGQGQEEQIVVRDENSWLVEGGTPIEDVMRILDIDDFPDSSHYETIAGFMMFRLRKIPKRTDSVKFGGYKFEVVDIDNYKIDQLLVTRIIDPTAQTNPSNTDQSYEA